MKYITLRNEDLFGLNYSLIHHCIIKQINPITEYPDNISVGDLVDYALITTSKLPEYLEVEVFKISDHRENYTKLVKLWSRQRELNK